MNYKIEVKSKEQADEAESLASDLGYAMDDTFSEKWSDRYCYLLLCGDMSAGFGCELMAKGDEPMSMTELRALVSLHKNPINMDKVLSEVRSDALGLLNDQYAEIEQVRKEYKLKNNISVDDYINSLRCEDTVNHPSHYASGEIECIDAIESSMTNEAFCGYLKGNVQKYMWRYENKGGLESLEKAQWYLNKLISRVG